MKIQVIDTIKEFQEKIPSLDHFTELIGPPLNTTSDGNKSNFITGDQFLQVILRNRVSPSIIEFYKNASNEIEFIIKKSKEKPTQVDINFAYIVYWKIKSFIKLINFSSKIWFYKEKVYLIFLQDTEILSEEEQQLLIYEYYDKDRKKWERLNHLYGNDKPENDISSNSEYIRERIPERIRIEVWRRDGGKCAQCGSREKIEYDHIVPVSKGGSNTARNIELLCEKCNRQKSANIQ